MPSYCSPVGCFVGLLVISFLACAAPESDTFEDTGAGASAADGEISYDASLFAKSVVDFSPGEGAGFGQDRYPNVVLGPPQGRGASSGSLDVLSLGRSGSIVLGFEHDLVDGSGADLIVFENPFGGPDGTAFQEAGIVSASADGVEWHAWPCANTDKAGGFVGCAGVHPVHSAPGNGIWANDPDVAGGDAFDLSAIGLAQARFVKITDGGENPYGSPSGGFDLDAVALVHTSAAP